MYISAKKMIRNVFLVLVVFLFIVLLYITHIMASVLVPIFLAVFSAMILDPFIKKLHKTKIPNWLSTIIAVVLFLSVISVIFTVIGISFGNFVADLPDITREFVDRTITLVKTLSKNELARQYVSQDDLINIIREIISIDNFKNYIIAPVGKTLDVFKAFGLYTLALIFILPGMGKISEKISNAFPAENGLKINNIVSTITEQIQNYMVAKTIVSFIVGSISFIICAFFGVEYALLWGAVIFLFNFIPIIGSIIAVLFPIALSIVQNMSVVEILILSVLLISAQIIMGNIVEPRFMSKGVNLSPFVIFTSLMVWGYIWGIVGVILSVPIMSAINLICENIDPLKPISVLISAKRGKRKIFVLKNKKIVEN